MAGGFDTYQAAARMAIRGEVDASFFLAEAYHSLSRLTKTQLKPLIESKLADITHVLLIHPRIGDGLDKLKDALVSLTGTPDGQPVLEELGIEKGFEAMSVEDGEFMIDLMDTRAAELGGCAHLVAREHFPQTGRDVLLVPRGPQAARGACDGSLRPGRRRTRSGRGGRSDARLPADPEATARLLPPS